MLCICVIMAASSVVENTNIEFSALKFQMKCSVQFNVWE